MKNATKRHSIELRDVTPPDLPRLLSMVHALAVHHEDVPRITAEALNRDVLGASPWVYVLIAAVEGQIVGYASLCPLTRLQFGLRGIDMHNLFVEEDFRGAGIGRLLIDASMQKARALSCSYMAVGTLPDNSNAQAVYLACGFDRLQDAHPKFRITLEP